MNKKPSTPLKRPRTFRQRAGLSLGVAAVLALVIGGVWLRGKPSRTSPEVVLPREPALLDPAVRGLIDRLVADVKTQTDDGARHGRLGLAYEANGLWPEAHDSFALATALAPGDMVWRYHLAVATQEAGDFEEALERLQEIATEYPAFAPVQQRLGRALRDTADFDGALRAFQYVIETAPERPEGYVGVAEIWLQKNEPARALAVLETALEVDPRHRGVHYLLGLAYQDLGRNEEAARELALGVETTSSYLPDPLSAEVEKYRVTLPAQIARAGALREAGRLADSARVLAACLAHHPHNLTVLNNLAIAHIGLGELDRAHEYLFRAIEIDGGNFETHAILASWALETGRVDEALGYADAAVERGSRMAQTHMTLAQVLVQLGRYEEATESMEEALRLEVRNPQIYLGLAVLYEALGRLTQVRELYLRAIGQWPDLLPAHLGLGSAALALGRFDEAESALAAARALAPDAPEVVDLEQRLRARLQGP